MLQTKKKIEYQYEYKEQITKKEKKAVNGRILFIYVVFLLIVGLILVMFIGQSVKITHLNYQVSSLKETVVKLDQINHQLNLDVARNSSLTRIEKIARDELQMVEPEKMEILVINEPKDKQAAPAGENKDGIYQQVVNLIKDKIGTVKAESPE